MPTAVLGDRACGKTTFIALLYAAQIQYTDEEANKEIFKFTSEPHVTSYMGELFNQLKMGRWPDATMKGQTSKISFLFGYRSMMKAFAQKLIGTKRFEKPYDTLKFTVYDVAGEDVQDIIRTPDGYLSEEIPDEAKELLESRVLVFLIDAQKISAKVRSKGYMKMINYDKEMATLISLISSYNSRKKDPEQRRIYPVIVFTKFDMVPRATLQAMGLDADYPPVDDMKARRAYSETILKKFYEQTLAYLKGGMLKGVSFDKAAYFFSEVQTGFNEDQGIESPLMKGERIDYSYDEYEAFIKYFKKVANDMPDQVKEAQEFVSEF